MNETKFQDIVNEAQIMTNNTRISYDAQVYLRRSLCPEYVSASDAEQLAIDVISDRHRTEFGRTPITEGLDSTGRDHHPEAFTGFLAGAGVQKGLAYGASDELGFDAVENPMPTHDFHATILYLLGLQHTQLTFYHNGILRRLTDVHGHIHTGLFA